MHRPLRARVLAVVLLLPATPQTAVGTDNPVDRWAAAVGGRDRVGAVAAFYREATITVGGFEGTIKAWRTSDGKYRKEEQIAAFSNTETFDGLDGTIQQGLAPTRKMTLAELARARSTAFANSSAMFFAFFPDRRQGSLIVEPDDTIVLRPEGGIDWRVTLDPQTSLPYMMVHREGERTITVRFTSYQSVDGIKFEKEIHRSTGDPRFDAVIRFTKTVVNPAIDPSLFSMEPRAGAGSGQ